MLHVLPLASSHTVLIWHAGHWHGLMALCLSEFALCHQASAPPSFTRCKTGFPGTMEHPESSVNVCDYMPVGGGRGDVPCWNPFQDTLRDTAS
jgi:hypothetical protein